MLIFGLDDCLKEASPLSVSGVCFGEGLEEKINLRLAEVFDGVDVHLRGVLRRGRLLCLHLEGGP